MEGLTVRMQRCGSFDLAVGDVTWRVVHEVSFNPIPWVVVAMDSKGRHALYESFATIDEALSSMIAVSGAGDASSRFRVLLPCGQHFLRPGKVRAESVISTLGWTHTKRYIGYMVLSLPERATNMEARERFRRNITIGSARIGEMTCVERADGLSHWCADILLDRDGFVRWDEFQQDAARAFSPMRGEMLENYDFVPRIPTVPNAAVVIGFPEDRIRRPAA